MLPDAEKEHKRCREARAIPSPAFVVNKYSKYNITVKKLVVYTRDGVVAGTLLPLSGSFIAHRIDATQE